MICSRCGDLIVEDRFLDWNARWRCLKCGHLQDAVIIQSCLTRQKQTLVLQSAEPDYDDEEVHLSAESIIRPEVTVQYFRKRRSVQGA